MAKFEITFKYGTGVSPAHRRAPLVVEAQYVRRRFGRLVLHADGYRTVVDSYLVDDVRPLSD